jgi:hypothetical protein
MIYADTPGPVNKTFLTVEPVVSIYIDMTGPSTNIYIPYLAAWDVDELPPTIYDDTTLDGLDSMTVDEIDELSI